MKIHLIDDDLGFCKSMIALLEEEGYETEAYHSGNDFNTNCLQGDNECVLLDLRIPGTDTLDLVEEINHAKNPVPVLMMSGVGQISDAVNAVKTGARDFLVKPIDIEEVGKKIQSAMDEPAFNKKISLKEVKEFRERLAQLTLQESRVVTLITEGLLNKEIAHQLDLSVRTVENYRANAMAKLMVTNTANLFKLYFH